MPRRLYILVSFVLLLGALTDVSAQLAVPMPQQILSRARVIDGDTVPYATIPEVRIYARRRFKSKREQTRYSRMVWNVKRVLPYARIAAERLTAIEDSLQKITDERQRKAFIKSSEEALFAEFEKPLRKLTITQGKILIKLIDRETGDTSFQLIRTLKGRFSAFMWQSVARIFGSNLKMEYDPEGKDKQIETIVLMIDDGKL